MTSDYSGNEFDAERWEAQWRVILPQLRKRVATFPVESHEDVDEIVNEAGARLFAAQTYRRKRDAFLRVAEATARRIVLERERTARRRASGPRARAAQLAAVPDEWLADSDAIERHRVELRLAVEQVKRRSEWADLKPPEKEALDLIEAGGPYADRERKVISRAREKLTELFRECLGGVFVGGRWLRARIRQPCIDVSPLASVVAGAVAAVVVGAFPPSGATAGPRQAPTTNPGVVKATTSRAETPPARITPDQSMPPGAVSPRLQQPTPGDPPPSARPSVSAKLPSPDTPGVLTASVPVPTSDGRTAFTMTIRCDSGLKRSVCDAVDRD